MNPIKFYHEYDPYGEFSNYYLAAISVEGKTWPSVEHYYQAKKTLDPAYAERIRLSETPDDAKTLGNSAQCPVRPDWDAYKVTAMRRGLYAKFTQHRDLRDLLLSSGDEELMEDSSVDYFWGIGEDGTGLNMLGKSLMDLRDALRGEAAEKGAKKPFSRGRLMQRAYMGGVLTDAAMGRAPCDLIIENARIVNVLTGEIYAGSIAVREGVIVHVTCPGETMALKAGRTYDAKGRYAIPGLFDSHLHIESTMLTPDHFARAVLPHGTTTAVTDPHEIANVAGEAGVRYMLEASEDVPMRQFILVPSCVPSVPGLERAGAAFGADEVRALLEASDRVLGVAEVMDYIGVVRGDRRMRSICELADGRQLPIQGHAPTLSGPALSAYLLAGPCLTMSAQPRPRRLKSFARGCMWTFARPAWGLGIRR